ncbi:VOC family protein [Catalinimonas niigatensis]|uniref:VOC family protein n=1 Tax=Catalinimonas niigatensis TaxID=1397264 RepID=UPI002AA29E0B|nr:VOC family protein [Catalinimonas niigatensis]WPP53124.1 VOC family protein [Catalinimonas niigatensis]
MIKIEHIALWTQDLERSKEFYIKYFGAKSNDKYHNQKKQLETYFLQFDSGARLEIMKRPEVHQIADQTFLSGLTHLAFSLGSKEKVDELTETLVNDGYKKMDGPRTTGDGYYESLILDPDGNQIELTV